MFLPRCVKFRLPGVRGWLELIRPMAAPDYWLAYDARQKDIVFVRIEPGSVTVSQRRAKAQK
jgi:hypothetical protein